MAGESCKETIEVKSLLRAAPANRFSSCSTLIKNSKQQSVEVVFGTGQQIAIWNCTNRNRYPPLKLLKGHQAYVTVIKNLGANSLGFVSGDLNGTVLVWAPNLPASDGGNVEASVQEYLIVAGASDGCLTSWKISITPSMGRCVIAPSIQPPPNLRVIKAVLNLGNQIALDAALAFIPNQSKHLLLALAGTDNKVAIYSLDFPSLLQPNNLLLVSGSQDNFIRIWRCDQQDIPTTQRPLDPVTIPDNRRPFQTLDELTQALKEEGQLTSMIQIGRPVEMKRYPIKDTRWNFVSDAILYDRSMIMWRPSEEFDNIWLNVERFGELGTSTNLGPLAPTISSVRMIKQRLSGFGMDSVLASPQNNLEVLSNPSWHEICRPQAHGHNLFGVSFIGDRRSRFVSISEEKVIRVFDMTQDFLQVTQELGITQLPFDKVDARPQRAIVPPLGLSNRVEDTEKDQKEQQDPAGQQSCPHSKINYYPTPMARDRQNLRSSIRALRDHDLHCGRIIASACMHLSQTASIRLHSADDFSPIQPGVLEAHQLTVTRLVFNSDASKLLSVSRDRSWTIWNKSPSSDGFVIDQRMEKAHARVIWDACWATIPLSICLSQALGINRYVKTWIQSGQDNQVSWDVAHASNATAVKSCAISTQLTQQTKMLLAVGLEDGFISLYMSVNPSGWERIGGVELTSIHHAGPVNRLAFSPKVVEAGKFRLASGGEDEVVQIVDLNLNP
ncbi:hypothetical protein H4Q26_011036 [Puccinia striiformis f. sp. tritici PST-130]|nr:hypothetical protein H4Q26_011036 [Puccinia striiformis f. sp. tritici PST-130]